MTVATLGPLHYQRQGTGPPLVLLHGFGGCWQNWEPVLDRLSGRRDVIAVDMLGFGGSPHWPHGEPLSIDVLVDRMEHFLDELDLDQPHLAGNSLGGVVALELAKRRRASSATVLSPAAFLDWPARLYVGTIVGGLQGLAVILPPVASDQLLRIRPVRNLVLRSVVRRPRQFSDSNFRASARSLRHAPLVLPAARGLVYTFEGGPGFDVPVTVAWGTGDRILWVNQVRLARRRLPHARMVPLPGCGHVPMSDAPDLVAEVLLEGSQS